MLKSALPTIIWIRHTQVAMAAAEAYERADFGLKTSFPIQTLNIGEIGFIHGDDEIEFFQILRLDLPALLATALAVMFPVDNLYGKVDLPLVLLEAMALGTPIVAASGGPLEELEAVRLVAPQDPAALSENVLELLANPVAARTQAKHAQSVYAARFSPAVVAAAYDAVYRRFG